MQPFVRQELRDLGCTESQIREMEEASGCIIHAGATSCSIPPWPEVSINERQQPLQKEVDG